MTDQAAQPPPQPVRRDEPRRRWSWWILAALVALAIPSPFGMMAPLSLLLWGLVGDPRSLGQALASVAAGASLLAIYTLCVWAFVRLFIARMLGRLFDRHVDGRQL